MHDLPYLTTELGKGRGPELVAFRKASAAMWGAVEPWYSFTELPFFVRRFFAH